MLRLESPWYLLLILPLLYIFLRNHKKPAIAIPSIGSLNQRNKLGFKYKIGKILIFISMLLGIFALTRPQHIDKNHRVKKDGVDIVLALDISRSMLASDIKPNRLAGAKEVIDKFVEGRVDDRLGLVAFAGNAYTRVPLTFDRDVILESIKNLGVGDISNNQATAIGLGTGVALNRLKNSTAKTKIIILLTDGENNAGDLSPNNAAQLAKELGVKIYTVGIGGDYIEINDIFGKRKVANTEIDEKLLIKMAKDTGGSYFRAKDNKSFEEIFEEIDKLEKTKIDSREIQKKTELYRYFLIPALVLLTLGLYFEKKRYIIIP